MEAGITQYFSRIGAERGMVLEHAECRSGHCEVAGYVIDGYPEHDYITIVGLRNESWWDGGKQGGGTSRREDGRLHFVYVLVRHDLE